MTTVLVKVGGLFLRDYPRGRREEGGGQDYSLTTDRKRATRFHVDDVPSVIAAELTVKGVRAVVVNAEDEGVPT
jgi:hypothetical protein